MVNVTGIEYVWIGHISPLVLKEKFMRGQESEKSPS